MEKILGGYFVFSAVSFNIIVFGLILDEIICYFMYKKNK